MPRLGRPRKVHNPGYGNADSNVTLYTYDGQGRVTNVQYADASSQETFSWSGDTMIHTDPAGIQTKQRLDALGRIVQVVEVPSNSSDPNYATTNYTYDALDDLIGVTRGNQTRGFGYNSLKELVWAVNPETNLIASCNGSPGQVSACYTYDANGNLLTRAVAAGTATSGSLQTSYSYDGLDRMLTKQYNDGSTPYVTYCYDGMIWSGTNGQCSGSSGSPALGRSTGVGSSASSVSYSYDQLGRIISSTQTTGTGYTFGYTYNLADALTKETYPSGRAVSYSYDSGNRVTGVSGVLSGASKNYATSIQYAAHGPLASMALNNSTTEQWTFNNRLQPTQTLVGASTCTIGTNCPLVLSYFYCANSQSSCTTNNGNLASQTIQRNAQAWAEAYTYDSVNRLGGVQENSVSLQSYGYDPNGNWYLASYNGALVPAPTTETPRTASWYLPNNRVNTWGYDNAGNLTAISGVSKSFTFDAENRQVSANIGGTGGTNASYTYDGDGHRVTKIVNGGVTAYVYDAFGHLVAEYGGAANPDAGLTTYLSADHLGSTRLVADGSGNQRYCYDYLAFGGDLLAGANARPSCYPSAPAAGVKFTGKERDAETGIDSFGARYLSSAQGRFTSPDRYNPMLIKQGLDAGGLPGPMTASLLNGYVENPQNWNQYAYVRNNPLRFTDPTGAAPAEGHHLITGRQVLTSPLAKDFTNAIKSGPLSGNGFPNQPGFNAMHRAYNGAVEEALTNIEQTAGDRNAWSLKQWKDAATQILNSDEPAIKEFLDELEANNTGAKAAIGAAISAYRVSLSVAARMIAADLAADLTMFVRMPMIIMVDPAITNPQKRMQEEIKKSHANCLLDRETGNCIQ